MAFERIEPPERTQPIDSFTSSGSSVLAVVGFRHIDTAVVACGLGLFQHMCTVELEDLSIGLIF
jgi:hypothetical protein